MTRYRGHVIRVVRDRCPGGWMQVVAGVTLNGRLLRDCLSDSRGSLASWTRHYRCAIDSALDGDDAYDIHGTVTEAERAACRGL